MGHVGPHEAVEIYGARSQHEAAELWTGEPKGVRTSKKGRWMDFFSMPGDSQ